MVTLMWDLTRVILPLHTPNVGVPPSLSTEDPVHEQVSDADAAAIVNVWRCSLAWCALLVLSKAAAQCNEDSDATPRASDLRQGG